MRGSHFDQIGWQTVPNGMVSHGHNGDVDGFAWLQVVNGGLRDIGCKWFTQGFLIHHDLVSDDIDVFVRTSR